MLPLLCLLSSRFLINTSSFELPTRSRVVAEYMVGLEKIKRKAGDVSNSVRGLTHDDILALAGHCMRANQSDAERRWGVMRFVSLFSVSHRSLCITDLSAQSVYLLAFLMVLRMDEALKITFENVENVPWDSKCCCLHLPHLMY